MADTIEMQDIRGFDIDKAVKSFALVDYVFKNDCTISGMTGDSVRWYKETAADLTATSPAQVKNISPLSTFTTLEPSWTRVTSYVKKFAAESFLSMEDMKSADIDVLARTLLRLTRAVVKQVDTEIFNTLTENLANSSSLATATTNYVYTSGEWLGTACDPIGDILEAKRKVWEDNYNPEGASLYMSPTTHEYLVRYLIGAKGSSIPNYSSSRMADGTIMQLLGLNVKVSNNVSFLSGGALLVIPKQSCTWKQYQDTTSRVIDEPGIGSKVRVWELGIGLLTDPLSVCVIKGTELA